MQRELCILFVAAPLLAQTSRGTVAGTVTDVFDARIAAASVTLTNTETGVSQTTVANPAGLYRFDAVDLGLYNLKVAHPGFKAFTGVGFRVEANRTTTIDPRLELGAVETSVEVNAESAELLAKEGPLRGGNFQANEVRDLPLTAGNPLSLARALPGVVEPDGSTVYLPGNSQPGGFFSVNGARPRANNYLLDGTDNNDINYAGPSQVLSMADAIAEVSVQTGNFGVEFGRAGGAVFNLVVRSGTNNLHGTLLWRFRSQRFESASNTAKLQNMPKSVFTQNTTGFTLGGPMRKNRTFFFVGFQQDLYRTTANYRYVLPTQAAVDRLRTLFPANPRLDLYFHFVGNYRGTALPIGLELGADPATGVNRGPVQFGTTSEGLAGSRDGPQWVGRVDHNLSDSQRLSIRYLYGSYIASPDQVIFPGFIRDQSSQDQNALLSDSFTFLPAWTNEFRLSYGRMVHYVPNFISSRAIPEAFTQPQLNIASISTLGFPADGQYQIANNWLLQETQTRVIGRHTLRYGTELAPQAAKQGANVQTHGRYDYTNSVGYSALANFLDDYSGPSGLALRTFGEKVFYPSVFRHSYYFQDTWKATPSLTLTLGLRYENFGQPANSYQYAAFSGFDPAKFFEPSRVNNDNNNFGPAFGLAWSPSYRSGLAGKLFGDRKSVWRGGYQVSYDPFFNQLLSILIGPATPNSVQTQVIGAPTGRGTPNWYGRIPTVARAASLLDAQNLMDKNIRNSYTERWSFGLQRELPARLLLDLAYVGSESHKLDLLEDVNVQQPSGIRLHPDFGDRGVITSQGNSAYHALQALLNRRFASGVSAGISYTWSKNLDSVSDVGGANSNSQSGNRTSLPASQGGLKLDRGLSDYDRAHRLSVTFLWQIPGPGRRLARHVLGGWMLSGIAAFQSGVPYTVLNGSDRSGDGRIGNDRPDIGNPRAPLNSRAVMAPATGARACPTGYSNPDTGACVTPGEVHFVEGRGYPNAATVGRNTLRAGGINNLDAGLFKSFTIHERKRIEFRWDALNAFNHPQFTSAPGRTVTSPAPGRFLNPNFNDARTRSMWGQVKVVF